MSRIINFIKTMAKKKEVVLDDVVLETLPEEVKDEVVEVRDEEFYKKHTGAQDNVIYG